MMLRLLNRLRIFQTGPTRLSEEVFQNIVLATVQNVFSRYRAKGEMKSPQDVHDELVKLFIETIGDTYITLDEIKRAKKIFWQWVPKLVVGSII